MIKFCCKRKEKEKKTPGYMKRPIPCTTHTLSRTVEVHSHAQWNRSSFFAAIRGGKGESGGWEDKMWKILEKRQNCSRYIIKVLRTVTACSVDYVLCTLDAVATCPGSPPPATILQKRRHKFNWTVTGEFWRWLRILLKTLCDWHVINVHVKSASI